MTEPTLTGRTVLVTGGAGFVGSHLAEALVGDNEVRVLDDCSTGAREHVPDRATFLEGDVRDRETLASAMADVDVVFHEAAMVSVPASVERPLECHATNGTASVELLDLARAEDARVVFASSAAVYGRPASVPVAEDDPARPTSPYGVEKLAADHYVRIFAERYGLPTVALRYFNVYGPRQRGPYSGVLTTFLNQALSGDAITVEGDGDQTRDFVHVEDIVRANLLAARTDATGRAFNVGTGTSVAIEELAHAVRDVTGAGVPITHVDPRPGDVGRSRADLSRARADLGYEPAVGLHDGLADLVATVGEEG